MQECDVCLVVFHQIYWYRQVNPTGIVACLQLFRFAKHHSKNQLFTFNDSANCKGLVQVTIVLMEKDLYIRGLMI